MLNILVFVFWPYSVRVQSAEEAETGGELFYLCHGNVSDPIPPLVFQFGNTTLAFTSVPRMVEVHSINYLKSIMYELIDTYTKPFSFGKL